MRCVSVSAGGLVPSGGARQKPQRALQYRVTRKQIIGGRSLRCIARPACVCK